MVLALGGIWLWVDGGHSLLREFRCLLNMSMTNIFMYHPMFNEYASMIVSQYFKYYLTTLSD